MTNEINLFNTEVEEELTDLASSEERMVKLLKKVNEQKEEEAAAEQSKQQAKQVIEALLFSSNTPLTIPKIREVTDTLTPLKPREIKELIEALNNDYIHQKRAFEILEIGHGYALRSRQEFGKYVEILFKTKRGERLSPAAAETLAIIAYKQPVTRSKIDGIRGVDSSGTVYSLVERGLIEVTGRLEAPGRPSLYATTQQFLQYYGLKSLDDLPVHPSEK